MAGKGFEMELRRRDFMRLSGAMLITGFLPHLPAAGESIFCPHCGAQGFFSNRCYNCGGGWMAKMACSKCIHEQACLQIPFPNRRLVVKSDKPFFSLEMVHL